jgi:uncharacterized protein
MSDFSKTGYDLENRHFHQVDIEKIETIREMRSATRKALEKEIHWMRCPKCGEQMKELQFEGILVDKCSSCAGVYFDQGELDVLMKHRESDTFFNKISSLFK